MKKRWYKYPEGYIEYALPWYLIIRRLIFLPFVAIGFVFLYIGIALGWGIDEAERMRKEIW
jgi:hypothetical protein